MGLHPIDLQTIYTQLDKISKSAVAEQQGAQLARAMKEDETQKQELLRSETVQEVRTDNESLGAVDDKNRRGGAEQQKNKKKKAEAESEEDDTPAPSPFAESYLGQHIDVSG